MNTSQINGKVTTQIIKLLLRKSEDDLKDTLLIEANLPQDGWAHTR